MKSLLKSKKLTSMSTKYKKVNKFLSRNYKKEQKRCIKQFYIENKVNEYKHSKILLSGNQNKDLTRFFTENPGGLIKKRKVIFNKIIKFNSPRKFAVVICLFGYCAYSFVFQCFTQITPDTRPTANEFENVEILPNNPDIERDNEGKIILNPVKNDELMAVESKLESQLEKGLKYFEINNKIDNIYGIFNHPATDPSHGNENIIDIIVGSGNKTYSLQYYDIENERQNFDGINEENATKNLTSFINLLKSSVPYYAVEINNENKIGEPFAYVNKDSSSIYKIPVYSNDYKNCTLYTLAEDEFDEDYATKIYNANTPKETVSQSYTSVYNSYQSAISNISNITLNEYIDILNSYNIKSPDTDYNFKQETNDQEK